MMSSSKLYIAFSILLFSIFFGILFLVLNKKTPCKKKQSVLESRISGYVVGKYLDETHHNYETLEVRQQSDVRRHHFLLFEKSGAFQFVMVGDSIYKEKNTLILTVIRKSETYHLNLVYDCED